MQGFINLWELLSINIFEPIASSFDNIEWINDIIDLLSKLLTTIFNYEITVTSSHAAALVTLISFIICLKFIIKLFVTAFTTITNSFENIKKGKRKR